MNEKQPITQERRPDPVGLLSRHGPALMRTARRYAPTHDDAEDAYQRSVEILLTKAPEIPEAELVPWMKTVIKHEAFAIRRSRERSHLGTDGPFEGEPPGERALVAVAGPDERAEQNERLRLGAEAMGRLKPQEVRCLTLLAEGYSYKQIQEETGFSYTKVNRCLAEGRQRFIERVAGIESGAECRRLAPLLSAFADGHAGAADVAMLRPHLRTCLMCRATLREYRETPARVALHTLPALGLFGPVHGALEHAVAGVREWLSAHALGARAAIEGAGMTKAVATVSAVVVAVGGTAGLAVRADGNSPAPPPPARAAVVPSVALTDDVTRRGADRPPVRAARTRSGERPPARRPRRRTVPETAPARTPSGPAVPAAASAPVAAPAPVAAAPQPPSAPPGGGDGEFGP